MRLTAALFVLLASLSANALNITQPASGTVVTAGDDFATQVVGNAWDMNDPADIDTQDSVGVGSQNFSGGVFSGTTLVNGAYIYPLFQGFPDSINLSGGSIHPIDTSHYRYVTIKLRATDPPSTFQFARAVFLNSGNSYNDGTFGYSQYFTLAANQWQILTFDLISHLDSTSPHKWTDFPFVKGLRIDPATTNATGAYQPVQFSVAWIRLTAPATNAQKTVVQWTDTGYAGTYNIFATDGGGTNYPLGAGVSGTSYAADLSFLKPGTYTITVTRSDSTASANTSIAINAPPEISIVQPSASGDLNQDFAKTVVSNPWGPIGNASVFLPTSGIRDFTNVVYSNPVGTFYGRPINNDPGWWFNLGSNTIDAGKFRSVCYKFEVFGPRDIGTGSVARIFWGSGTSQATTSLQIPVDDNVNDTVVSRYCIADLAAYPPDSTAPIYGLWAGTQNVFRIDPDEFTPPSACATGGGTPDTCHDVRLDSVTLSPFALANPGYTFKWSLTDADNPTGDTVDVYLDPDKTPLNGNEVHLSQVAGSNGQFAWTGSCANFLSYGPWNVLMVASDGINPVPQYAGGPLLIGRYDGIFRNGFESIPPTCP